MQQETVIVLDFGGQYNQLIARRVRECNVYCEIYSYKTDLAKIKARNPKGIIFMVAVLPQFMTTSRPLWLQLLILAATMLAVDTMVMHGYAASASALRGFMRSARAVRSQNRVFGALLMAVGTGLFFVQRASR